MPLFRPESLDRPGTDFSRRLPESLVRVLPDGSRNLPGLRSTDDCESWGPLFRDDVARPRTSVKAMCESAAPPSASSSSSLLCPSNRSLKSTRLPAAAIMPNMLCVMLT